ncbi:PilC/PilY family type IV pilus protein [Psychromonas sp. SP041]|uniref:pilus assembly protein n=1 Tax=Psychromonas sp. SP041 TaxID=1365007 RepID=UPI00040C8910|nr:PilC/PilY family type IV pilus protein [Psychromonas sp. SP041]
MKKILLNSFILSSSCLFSVVSVHAGNLDLATKPLYTGTTEAPMMMLVMGRDHTLFYEAYNDASDLDGDGELDTKFKPRYSYEGYFDPAKCYQYSESKSIFEPKVIATTDDKICITNSEYWSGNFLNYLTMTRMDVLRKVLYGGTRITDTLSDTVLERVFIPQDAHSWAKAYTSESVDGYDIRDYSPYELPNSNIKQHFFASVTYTSYDSPPSLQVIENAENVNNDSDWGVWNWASTERPVLNLDKDKKNNGDQSSLYDLHFTGDVDTDNYTVRVEVCVTGLLESNCKAYDNNNYKPTGLLHDYGEKDQMLFGLLTGSYNKNLSGGVLRETAKEFSKEINSTTGQFSSSDSGIVATINKLKIYGFNYTQGSSNNNYKYQDNCGFITTRSFNEGECVSWGNPVGEMLYESMRYYAGESFASSSYAASGDEDEELGLPAPTWDDPYDGRGTCARPNVLLISDINPSFDSDQLPGAYSSFSKSYNGSVLKTDEGDNFSITTLLNTISSTEGKTSGQYFIGQSKDVNDGAPTVKTINGLASIRGLAPAEPTKQGSYSSAAVAYYGINNDINKSKPEEQNVTTMVVALASNLPEINVDVDGETITIVPFAKSVGGGSISKSNGDFQPTNTIVDWYVESITPTKGIFQINFEDVEQGGDHDMDMIVKYTYEVINNACLTYNSNGSCATVGKGVQVSLDSTYAGGGVDQHAGYIISGTTNDGVYLEVRDQSGREVEYYLDTPIESIYKNREQIKADLIGTTSTIDETLLGLNSTRTFIPNSSDAAEFLPSPLWYAAKWGGFNDSNDNGKPDLSSEWDINSDGNPDNYFPVTNAGELKDQIAAAFDLAYDGLLTGSSPVYSSNLLTTGTLAYKSSFEEKNWNGDVTAYTVNSNGQFSTSNTWSAADQLDAMDPDDRHIFTRSIDGNVFEFTKPQSSSSLIGFVLSSATSLLDILTTPLSESQLAGLLGSTLTSASYVDKAAYIQNAVSYIRGDRDNETTTLGDGFRERTSLLGDIVNSTPYYVSSAKGHSIGTEIVAFAANDGMVHIVDANNGKELVAYIPSTVYETLGKIIDNAYIHEYSVDGGLNAYSDKNDLVDISFDGVTTEVSRTTLVGRLGLGVKGLYAIDVSNVSKTNPTADMMRWEITTDTSGFEDIGYSVSAPTLVTLANNKASVVFANGYNSTDNDGAIYIADLKDGSLIKKLSVGAQTDPTGLDRPNALAQPLLIDNNSDGIADYIYAGDLFGNMWVFDISSDDPNDWGIKKIGGAPLFTAISPTLNGVEYRSQSITTRPTVVRHPDGVGVLVAFGTGKYVESHDISTTDQATQSFYVIEDKLGTSSVNATRNSSGFSNLQKQSILKESSTNRLLSSHPLNWNEISGFYIDLVNTEDGNIENHGERQVVGSTVLGNKISFVTLIPGIDPCVAGGTGWYMELDLYTGQTWNAGTEVEDDPSTAEDESEEIPTDSSNQFIDGVATGISSVASVTTGTETITKADGTTEEITVFESAVGLTCITLSTNKQTCYDDDLNITGPQSWRNLY